MAEILLIASRGMLGRAVAAALDDAGRGFRAVDRPALELADRESINTQIRGDTRVVINCAAFTDVDGAEFHERAAHVVNAAGPGMLAERCRDLGATLVHFSTDYVFDGSARAPYSVDHPIAPMSAYGRTKAEGERRVRAATPDHLIVRTSWLYAPWGKNFVRTIAKLGRERETLRVVDDQRGRPSSAEQVARTTLALLDSGAHGTFHATDRGECTWFGFATAIAQRACPGCRVEPCTTEEFPRPAPRPAYSVLDVEGTEQLVGDLVPFEDELDSVLARLDEALR
jgi:dTDP-4-dehydrorhamnose reductase